MSSKGNTTQPTKLDKRIKKLEQQLDKLENAEKIDWSKILSVKKEIKRLEKESKEKEEKVKKTQEAEAKRRQEKRTATERLDEDLRKAVQTGKIRRKDLRIDRLFDRISKLREDLENETDEDEKKKILSKIDALNDRIDRLEDFDMRAELAEKVGEKKKRERKSRAEKNLEKENLQREEKKEKIGIITTKLANAVKSKGVEGMIEEFGTLNDNQIKTLLRFFRDEKVSGESKTFQDAFNGFFNKLNTFVDATSYKTFIGKNPELREGIKKFVPFMISKDFKPKQGNIQELVGEERVANMLGKFGIDRNSLLNYLENVDIEERRKETEGQVGGGFPEGFSVEEQIYNSIKEYTRKANLVSEGFEAVEEIPNIAAFKYSASTMGSPATKKTAFFAPGIAGEALTSDVKGTFEGKVPIRGRVAGKKIEIGKLEKDSPNLLMAGAKLYNYDPSLLGKPAGFGVFKPSVGFAEYAELQDVVDVLPVGEHKFTAGHTRGVGVDMNVYGSGSKVKELIDPLFSATEIADDKERLRQFPQQTNPIPFMRKSRVNVNASGAYSIEPSPEQIDPNIDVRPATSFIGSTGGIGYSPKVSFSGKSPIFTSPSAPTMVGTRELVVSYAGTDIEQEKLRKSKTIYPTLQQKVLIKKL